MMRDFIKEREIQKDLEDLWQMKAYDQLDGLFRVTDGDQTIIFNKRFIVTISEETEENSGKKEVTVQTIDEYTYTLNMPIDDFIDQMEGRSNGEKYAKEDHSWNSSWSSSSLNN